MSEADAPHRGGLTVASMLPGVVLICALAVSGCGGTTPANSSSAAPGASGPASSRPSASSPSGEPVDSAEPTDTPLVTDPPIVVSPLPTFGRPTATAGAPYAVSSPAESAGRGTLTLNQWAGPDVAGPMIQKIDFAMPCLWTSRLSVRGAFFQRLRLLGQNDVLVWSALAAPEGPASGSVTIFPDGPGMATAEEQYPSDPVEIAAKEGLISGTLTFRSLDVPAEMTTTGDAFVNGTIAWDCGSAPAGAPQAPTNASSPAIAGTVTVRSGTAAKAMIAGCGGTYYGPDGSPDEIPDCPATWDPIPATDALNVASGATIVISSGQTTLLSTLSDAFFVAPSGAANGSGVDVPSNAQGTGRLSATVSSLTFKAPPKGDWYVFVPLICVDGQGNRFEYWWAARILVG